MSDPEKKICRYFNTLGGCWYGDTCKFLHIPEKRPPCKFFWYVSSLLLDMCSKRQVLKENMDPSNVSGTNNNNMTHPTSNCLKICDPPSQLTAEKPSADPETAEELPEFAEQAVKTVSECPVEDNPEPIVDEEEKEPVSLHGMFKKPLPNWNYFGSSGSCKRVLDRRGNESYCNLLKDHYLECFLEKEGDHVKCVKSKAALEPGQMYWCKACILIFEKPWSLFQHMADKAKGTKVQRWERKIHLDWIDNVAGLMAGKPFGSTPFLTLATQKDTEGLFPAPDFPAKLRTDLRTLLADQHTVEEEMEAAAVAAAAMVQWLAPISSPWRLHQREMMRKIENLHRQMLRKAGGAAALARAALTNGSAAPHFSLPFGAYPFPQGNRYPFQLNRGPRQNGSLVSPTQDVSEAGGSQSPRLVIREVEASTEDEVSTATDAQLSTETGETVVRASDEPQKVQPRPSESTPRGPIEGETQPSESLDGQEDLASGEEHVANASGDHMPEFEPRFVGTAIESKSTRFSEHGRRPESTSHLVGSNNTNSVVFSRGDNGSSSSRPPHYYSGSKYRNDFTRGFDEKPVRGFRNGGGFFSRQRSYGFGSRSFEPSVRQPPSKSSSQSVRSMSATNLPTNLDGNWGFTDEEVNELLCQGIKPWDSEASAALAVLHGEMDHLLN
ncbi:unnamed protein product [Schistocephalus solidus]|uniref:C3H1-type domain-containing protein n=1 Tax=Schistocephalus solidus TaxID=70667 RepID=A0A183SY85_SCHSO|nr:unnamed protein product [Schistocephalus solidus]